MRLNRFVFLLASTVFVGLIMGVITSATHIWVNVYWYTGLIEGGFLATTSLMGFWAYLTLNFVARITLPRRVWRWAQILILALVLYDMFWSRYQNDLVHHPGTSYAPFFVQALWPFIAALIAAAFKRRMSGKGSYLPTVFFLYVFTVIDWLLVLWMHSDSIVNQTGIVMMVCNIYMVLIFGKLLTKTRAVPESVHNSGVPQRA